MHHPHADNETLLAGASCAADRLSEAGRVLTFDRLSSVFISNTNHEEHQPAHLKLLDPAKADRGQLERVSQP